MCPEPIRPSSPEPTQKKDKKIVSPDSDQFQDLMKIDKTKEVEFEEQKKRKYQTGEEPEEAPETAQGPETPPSTSTYQDYYNEPGEGDFDVDFDYQIAPQEMQTQPTLAPDEKAKVQLSSEELEKLKKELYETGAKPKKTIEAAPTITPSIQAKKAKTKSELEIKQEALQVKKEKEAKAAAKTEEEIKKKKVEAAENIPQSLIDLPKSVALEAMTLTAALTPYLNPDIVPLFEKMIGTIINIQTKDITQTQVLLNSPAFASSVFFGSKITLTKFSIAPDSYNIELTGSNQAVNLFNENLEGLMNAFQNGKFNFRIGKLEAVYESEKPLIKRKTLDEGQEDL
ncbi:MAG: hypothetical protein HZB76_03710 [Chlamydiae bacterium]|nr:hypothetical protein [Chlamydiota bacterium]